MTYAELERLLNDVTEALWLTEQQVGEIVNRVSRLGITEVPEASQMIALIRQILDKAQTHFYSKQQEFLSGTSEEEER